MMNSVIFNKTAIYIMSNSVVAEILCETLNDGPCELVKLHNGLIIALTPNAMGCYRNHSSGRTPAGCDASVMT